MNKSAARGPRPGRPDTREVIRIAARRLFIAEGYHGVTMRSIAADAGVDVALVSYYFTSKQRLFGAAMQLAANPAEIFGREIDGDIATLGSRVLRSMLTVWDGPETGAPLRAIAIAATTEPDLNRLVAEAVGGEIVARLAERLGGRDASHRAAAFSTQIAGVVYARYLLRLEPIASMSVAEVVRHLAPSLQLALAPMHA
jgi:AcrR family transcriptional regulator